MRWWRARTPPTESNVEEALRDQEQKVAQEKAVIAGLERRAQNAQRTADRKLVRAQEISHETEKVAKEIKAEEAQNGLAILFRRGIGGMT